MSPEIASGLFQIVGALLASGLFFFVGRSYEKRDRGQRQIIETDTTATQLVNPQKLGPISMYVDSSFILGQEFISNGEPSLSPVKRAYSYAIQVSNVGLDDIERPEIDITLSDEAIIVQVEVISDTIPQDKFEQKKDEKKRNYRRILPQYINRNTSLTISVLSINDQSPRCKIQIGGKGIVHQERSIGSRNTGLSTKDIIVMIAAGAALLYWFNVAFSSRALLP